GNGAGKSTLLKVLADEQEIDQGALSVPRGTCFGYLPQEGISFKDTGLYDEVVSAQQEVLGLEEALETLQKALETAVDEEQDALLHQYEMLSERFHHLGGYALEAEVGRVLDGLGFAREDWQKPCSAFSGGWQMRIALSKLLLQKPNWLLLDEPTNHLDLEARYWLEHYLKNYPAGILMVSHDRHFIDALAQRCAELLMGKVTDYPGNFSFYEVERERRYEALVEKARRQDEEIERLEKFIERFRYKASKASQVQSRVKQLEKMERVVLPPRPQKDISFAFPQPPRSGRDVLTMRSVHKSYGDLKVLQGVDFTLERGERVAIVGVNGAGKSTMMRIMSGQESFVGEREEGYQVQLSFFAQDQAKALDLQQTVLQSVEEEAPYEIMPKLRNLLGCFLFQGDDVFKKIAVLSGGEKSRVALLRMLMRPANLLLMDEPTNHLDMSSQQVLLQALRQYEGTVVLVSHDRYFLDQIATRVVEVKDGMAKSYLGNYTDYLQKKQAAGEVHADDGVRWTAATDKGNDVAAVKTATATSRPQGKEHRKQQHFEREQKRREQEKKRRQYAKEVEALEAQLEQQEALADEISKQMSAAGFYEDYEKAEPIIQQYDTLKLKIASAYERWEELQELLESLKDESEYG
ncbi:MAG: ABC-F family ATP-binding cassette domain-containing protein, partial [Myxococcota bacterium]